MTVKFRNFDFSYKNENGKPIYVPSDDGRRIGEKVKNLVETSFVFDPIYRHFRCGGHVGALHMHRNHAHFARIDLKNFFYTVSRGRVDRALRQIGVRAHTYFAKWSTVKNPYSDGGYVLPYGFVQSPILASLVIAKSPLGRFLLAAPAGIAVSIFLDDISVSSDDLALLQGYYAAVIDEIEPSGFVLHTAKSAEPSNAMKLFNCAISPGVASVLPERRAIFYASSPSPVGVEAFERYCEAVEDGNIK